MYGTWSARWTHWTRPTAWWLTWRNMDDLVEGKGAATREVQHRTGQSHKIADAWNTPGGKQHVDYFCKNRAHSIATFQDQDIEVQLRELWR